MGQEGLMSFHFFLFFEGLHSPNLKVSAKITRYKELTMPKLVKRQDFYRQNHAHLI